MYVQRFFMSGTLIIDSNYFSSDLQIGAGEIYQYSSLGVLGYVDSTFVYEGGKMTVSSGGVANQTILYGGTLEVAGSGEIRQTSVFDGGTLIVSDGARAGGITEIQSGGTMEVYQGAVVDNLGIMSGGSVTLNEAAAIENVALESGGRIGSFVQGGSSFCHLAGVTASGVAETANGVVISGTELTLLYDARAGYVEVFGSNGSAGTLHLTGVLTDGILIGKDGILSAGQGASINGSATVGSGGSMYISGTSVAEERATGANCVDLQSGGKLTVEGGVSVTECRVSSGAQIAIGGDADIQNMLLENGASVTNSGMIRNLELAGGASYNGITFYNCPGEDSDGSALKTTLEGLDENLIVSGAMNLYYAGVMSAGAGATVQNLLLRENGYLQNNSGTIISATIESGGVIETIDGTISSATINNGGLISAGNSTAMQEMVVNHGGVLYLNDSATASAVEVTSGGSLHFEKEQGIATDLIMSAGAMTNFYTQGGSGYASIGAMAGLVINGDTSGLHLASGNLDVANALASDTIIDSGAGLMASNGAIMSSTDIYGNFTASNAIVADAMIYSGGSLTTNKDVTFSGIITAGGRVEVLDKVTVESECRFVFDLSCRSNTDISILTNIDYLDGASFTIIVDDLMETGDYKLAITEKTFTDSVCVALTDGLILTEELTVGGDSLAANGLLFTLKQTGKQLYLSVTFDEPQPPVGLVGTADSLTWHPVANVDTYFVEYYAAGSEDHFRFSAGAEGVNTFGLQNGDYDWRVFSKGAKERFTQGETITVTGGTVDALIHWTAGEADGKTDVFFATASGKCGALDIAVNDLTGEKVNTIWKNTFNAVFTGSDDHSVIALTHDVRGDVFYLDNALLDYPDGVDEGAARFTNVEEILAGAGNDLIDMTSKQYSYEKITVRGGDDDDIIWGGNGINILYGDAGNDRISGNTGDDVLIGGSGDDMLTGGGGNDLFVFGEYSGENVIWQSDTGSVTLQFEGNITKEDLSISESDGDTVIRWGEIDSVTVKDRAASDITLKFVSEDDVKNGIETGYLIYG